MPHIHVQPGQHDMTVSGYIVRTDSAEPLCLVHMHRKMGKLMQIGGHIELDETPWQAIAHELEEESGYQLSELSVVQHTSDRIVEAKNISHPTPFTMNTHNVGNGHYHSDICFGFIATSLAQHGVVAGESHDLRWLTLSELKSAVDIDEALPDVYHMYHFLLDQIDSYAHIPAVEYSLDKPMEPGATYRYGAPGEK